MHRQYVRYAWLALVLHLQAARSEFTNLYQVPLYQVGNFNKR